MADVIDGVVTGHVLLLQEIGGVALALREDGDENVRARHLLASRRLDVNDRALDHALKTSRGLGVHPAVRHEIFKLRVDIVDEALFQDLKIHGAGAHDGGGVGVVEEAQQQMLQRRIFMTAFVGERERAMERLFEIA